MGSQSGREVGLVTWLAGSGTVRLAVRTARIQTVRRRRLLQGMWGPLRGHDEPRCLCQFRILPLGENGEARLGKIDGGRSSSTGFRCACAWRARRDVRKQTLTNQRPSHPTSGGHLEPAACPVLYLFATTTSNTCRGVIDHRGVDAGGDQYVWAACSLRRARDRLA
jgi:hypothetical protein